MITNKEVRISVNKTLTRKLIYIIAALTLLAMMIPAMAVPVSADIVMNMTNNSITDGGYNVTGAVVRVSLTGLPSGVTVARWINMDIVGLSTVTGNGTGVNSAWEEITGVFGETQISARLSNETVIGPINKKWGTIDHTVLTPAPGSSYVTWNEGTKSWSVLEPPVITDYVEGTFSSNSPHAAQGAILNWYLLSGNENVSLTPAEAPGLKTTMAGKKPATFARIQGTSPLSTMTQNVTNAAGKNSITIVTTGEEAIKIVVIPEYPGNPQIPVTPEVTSWNFKTREMEAVPQVRWAGEKIVLEKNFGEGYEGHWVKFSLENQSVGALEAIYGGGNLINSSTVWTQVDGHGFCSVILVSSDAGVANVQAALYEEAGRILPVTTNLINEHAFVVYFLKFESLVLHDVVGKRVDHNAGVWAPSNPWNPAVDWEVLNPGTPEPLNVSQDTLLRARVKGWFMSKNPTTRPASSVDIGGTYGLLLPEGRSVLPDDWADLAGTYNWKANRVHWDIMNAPNDTVVFGEAPLGDYKKSATTVATKDVIGPFSPGIEQMTDTGWATPNARYDSKRMMQTVVPNGNLDWWDAPMPAAKIIYEIRSGPGYFKNAVKSDIYYTGNPKVYTNPFYKAMIPAHEAIPPFINNGGYDWNSFNTTSYGPYTFWNVINQPDGIVTPPDAVHPTKVEVYSDNHGEAMVYLNGNSNLDLTQFLSNFAADVMPGALVGTTLVKAQADYPYVRAHQAIYSGNVTKAWYWGGEVLGTDNSAFGHQYPPTNATNPRNTRMVLTTGTYTIPAINGGTYPNQVGTSNKKLVFVWVTDRDGKQGGVLGAKVEWTIAVTSGSTPVISGMTGTGVDSYNPLTKALQLKNGFLHGTDIIGTNGSLTGSMDGHQGVSYLMDPALSLPLAADTNPVPDNTYQNIPALKALFYKFYNPTMAPAPALQPKDFAVAAIEVLQVGGATAFNVNVKITSPDFGMTGPVTGLWVSGLNTGTVIYNTNASFALPDPIDDAPIFGDANLDGSVNMGDVTTIERMILGLVVPNVNADADGSLTVDMGDVVKAERKILGY